MSSNPNKCNMSGEFCGRNGCRPAARCAMEAMNLAREPQFQPRPGLEVGYEAANVPAPAAAVAPGDWLASLDSKQRKECAVQRGFNAYFPDAIALVARHSVRMNEKHNPGEPVHWARGKSTDQPDCEARHLLAVATSPDARDADGAYEMVCKAWRAMADLQEWAERKFHRDGEIA
jgi:hypothetical protein